MLCGVCPNCGKSLNGYIQVKHFVTDIMDSMREFSPGDKMPLALNNDGIYRMKLRDKFNCCGVKLDVIFYRDIFVCYEVNNELDSPLKEIWKSRYKGWADSDDEK